MPQKHKKKSKAGAVKPLWMPEVIWQAQRGARDAFSKVANSKMRMYSKGYFGTDGKPFPLAVEFREQCKSLPAPNLLAFGDSVFERVASQDDNKRSLGDMIRERIGAEKSIVTSFSAYTPYMYGAFLRYAEAVSLRPKYVVIPFNLRCLSPQWDGCPIWQYTQENAILQAMAANPDCAINPVEPVFLDTSIYHAHSIYTSLSEKRTVGEFRAFIEGRGDGMPEEERLGQLLIYHYGVPASAQQRQLLFLRSAIETALRLRATVQVYLTPVNVDFMGLAVGRPLLDVVRANADLVRDMVAATSSNVVFNDWSGMLDSKDFFHEHEVTEHLAASGRQKLLGRIVQGLRKPESSIKLGSSGKAA